MLKTNIKRKNGFTLIELMIAILISSIVVAATITVYSTAIKGSSNTLKSSQLNQDMVGAMTIMTNDIRRAGYWGGAIVGANLTLNPFTNIEVRNVGAAALQVPTPGSPAIGNCITYSYDADAWDALGYDPDVDSVAPAAGEYYGFRLSNGSIQLRTSGSTSLEPDCDHGNDVWVTLSDPDEIIVTSLTFTLSAENSVTNAAGNTVKARQVEISINGEVASDSGITAVLNDVVKIRNNIIEP